MTDFLAERLNLVNETYFNLSSLPLIKWSKGKIKKKYRRITFGCYDIKKNEIRIHPVFKTAAFPSFVLDFVIFHEMLHYIDRDTLKQKRKLAFCEKRKIHDKVFKIKESKFPYSDRARKILRCFAEGKKSDYF
ncbi:MAG: hypothetical protein ACP5QT_00935 [Brevinematia bacterium]